jgi:hypothetical protein
VADVGKRLVRAQRELAVAEAVAREAQGSFEAARARVSELEHALDAACAEQAAARRERYAARQARRPAVKVVARLERRAGPGKRPVLAGGSGASPVGRLETLVRQRHFVTYGPRSVVSLRW